MSFNEIGTFEYRCGIRARMTGIIEVQDTQSSSDEKIKPYKRFAKVINN
jgi:hypothetical protein